MPFFFAIIKNFNYIKREIVGRKVFVARSTMYVSNAKSLPEVDEDWQ